MSTERRERGFLTLTIDGATEYFSADPGSGKRRCSPSVTLCGVEWTLEAYRCSSYLHARIRYAGSAPFRDDWRFYVTGIIRVRKSQSEDSRLHFEREISKEAALRQYILNTTISISSLLNPTSGYLKNNTVTLVCSVMVKSPASSTFDAKRRCADLRIVIGDRHFDVNKGLLATHCDYFEALFFGDVGDRTKYEFSLNGIGVEVAPDDFATFMRVMLLQEAINGRSVRAIMPMANYFGAKAILDECEKFVLDGEVFDLLDAIRIVDKCGMDDTMERLFAEVDMCDLKELASDDVLPTLSKKTSDLVTKELMRRLKQQE